MRAGHDPTLGAMQTSSATRFGTRPTSRRVQANKLSAKRASMSFDRFDSACL